MSNTSQLEEYLAFNDFQGSCCVGNIKKKNLFFFLTSLLTHNFHGSLVKCILTKSSFQDPTMLQSACQSVLLSHPRLTVFFQAHRWQNLVPCSYGTGILVLSMF